MAAEQIRMCPETEQECLVADYCARPDKITSEEFMPGDQEMPAEVEKALTAHECSNTILFSLGALTGRGTPEISWAAHQALRIMLEDRSESFPDRPLRSEPA